MNETTLYLLSTISMMLMLGCVVALQWQIEQLQRRPAPARVKITKRKMPVRPTGLAFICARTLQVGQVTAEGLAEVNGAKILVPKDEPVGSYLALISLGAR